MALDVGQLIADIKTVASEVIEKDITTVKGFSERQVKAIAQQAALVSSGILSGEITDETREFFLDGLKDMSKNFVKVLHGLAMVTVEKTWNAIVGVLWDTIETATGISLSMK